MAVCKVPVGQLTSKAQTQVKTLTVHLLPNKAKGKGMCRARATSCHVVPLRSVMQFPYGTKCFICPQSMCSPLYLKWSGLGRIYEVWL